jgi:5-formaminoimidazole-4-carboxamide-1-(beta)-D-ribofuranosyl 5'-monophosphate synthetase
MITTEQITKVLEAYDKRALTIGTLGGHSALDICRGAKDLGFRTVVVCQKGRERTYSEYYKNLVDEIILVDSFKDVVRKEVQEKLQALNTIFVHSRYFWVYCNFADIENRFMVPIFGTRNAVRAEERDMPKNQNFLLQKAKITTPKVFKNPKDIDRLVIVKAAEAERGYERAFFFVSNHKEYLQKSSELIKAKKITPASLKKALIEEFVVGPQVNLNFFYSPIFQRLELLGTDTRRQTNIDGILRLTAQEQLSLNISPQYIEAGHIAVTLKESLLEQAFSIGEKFVNVMKAYYPSGIIGPFALQGALRAGPPKEEFVIFDVSMRIPGSPGISYTPYSKYLFGEDVSMGKRIAMEIKKAIIDGKLNEIVT